MTRHYRLIVKGTPDDAYRAIEAREIGHGAWFKYRPEFDETLVGYVSRGPSTELTNWLAEDDRGIDPVNGSPSPYVPGSLLFYSEEK